LLNAPVNAAVDAQILALMLIRENAAVDARFLAPMLVSVHAPVATMIPVVSSESPSPYEKAIRVRPYGFLFLTCRPNDTETLSI
jgi:hypothetical protein